MRVDDTLILEIIFVTITENSSAVANDAQGTTPVFLLHLFYDI